MRQREFIGLASWMAVDCPVVVCAQPQGRKRAVGGTRERVKAIITRSRLAMTTRAMAPPMPPRVHHTSVVFTVDVWDWDLQRDRLEQQSDECLHCLAEFLR